MAALSMDQLPYLRGLRGLGADTSSAAASTAASAAARAATAAAAKKATQPSRQSSAPVSRSLSQGRAQAAVDRSNAQAEPIQQTVDRSVTQITMPGISARPQRVSPLAASWEFGIQPLDPAYDPYQGQGKPGMNWLVAGAGILIGVGALYLAIRE